MLSELRIKNFQAHEKLKLNLAHPIVAIVGCSDSGKSAVIRALRWVCQNVPNGDDFIRYGAKTASAELLFDDGRSVKRQRGAKGNLYFVDGAELKSFGVQPPFQVQDALRVANINFQAQHDTPYWFGESNGEVSRQLNAIVNLGIIDDSLGYVAGVVKRNRTNLELLREQHRSSEAQVAEYEHFEGLDEELRGLEDAQCALTSVREQCSELEGVLDEVRDKRAKRKELKAECDEMRVVLELAEASRTLGTQRASLEQTLESALRAQERSTPPPSMKELHSLHDASASVAKEANALEAFLDDMREAWKGRKRAQDALAQAKIDFEKTVGSTCPICGGPMHYGH